MLTFIFLFCVLSFWRLLVLGNFNFLSHKYQVQIQLIPFLSVTKIVCIIKFKYHCLRSAAKWSLFADSVSRYQSIIWNKYTAFNETTTISEIILGDGELQITTCLTISLFLWEMFIGFFQQGVIVSSSVYIWKYYNFCLFLDFVWLYYLHKR